MKPPRLQVCRLDPHLQRAFNELHQKLAPLARLIPLQPALEDALQGKTAPLLAKLGWNEARLRQEGGLEALKALGDALEAESDESAKTAPGRPLRYRELAHILLQQDYDDNEAMLSAQILRENLMSLSDVRGAAGLLGYWTLPLAAIALRDIRNVRVTPVPARIDLPSAKAAQLKQTVRTGVHEIKKELGGARLALRALLNAVMAGQPFIDFPPVLILPLPLSTGPPTPSRRALTPDFDLSQTLRDACHQARDALKQFDLSRLQLRSASAPFGHLMRIEAALKAKKVPAVRHELEGFSFGLPQFDSVPHRLAELWSLARRTAGP